MTMTEMAKGALDKALEKVVSRKLLVWVTGDSSYVYFPLR